MHGIGLDTLSGKLLGHAFTLRWVATLTTTLALRGQRRPSMH